MQREERKDREKSGEKVGEVRRGGGKVEEGCMEKMER